MARLLLMEILILSSGYGDDDEDDGEDDDEDDGGDDGEDGVEYDVDHLVVHWLWSCHLLAGWETSQE